MMKQWIWWWFQPDKCLGPISVYNDDENNDDDDEEDANENNNNDENNDEYDDSEHCAGNRASGLGIFADFRLPCSGWNDGDDSDDGDDDDDDEDGDEVFVIFQSIISAGYLILFLVLPCSGIKITITIQYVMVSK